MDKELAGRVHRNLMSVNSWMGQSAGGAVHSGNGELFFASASELPFLNGVMREKPAGDADDLLARARSFFFERNRGFVAFTWPGDSELEAICLGRWNVSRVGSLSGDDLSGPAERSCRGSAPGGESSGCAGVLGDLRQGVSIARVSSRALRGAI
jgi:hypothetical protein